MLSIGFLGIHYRSVGSIRHSTAVSYRHVAVHGDRLLCRSLIWQASFRITNSEEVDKISLINFVYLQSESFHINATPDETFSDKPQQVTPHLALRRVECGVNSQSHTSHREHSSYFSFQEIVLWLIAMYL